MENPFDAADGWLLKFLLEDQGPEPPDLQGPQQEQSHHCAVIMATAEATATGEVDVDVGAPHPVAQHSPGTATTAVAESEEPGRPAGEGWEPDSLETSMLWPGSCSMVADVPERAPTLRMTPEELRYQEAWARSQEMHRLRASTRSRSRPAPQNRGAQRTGINKRKAVMQRRWPEKPLNKHQIAGLCEEIVAAEIATSSENFKVGLTTDLDTRFDFYRREGVTRMVLLYSAEDPELAKQLERTLISFHMNEPRCRNVAPGGEGINTGQTPVHVYVAFGGGVPPDEPRLLSFWPRATASSSRRPRQAVS